jgi:hypothetical protein
VSDPRTDHGVRVRGPRVGSLTPRLLSDDDDLRGEGRRADRAQMRRFVRKANALQEKSSKHAALIVAADERDRDEFANILEGRWSPWVHHPSTSPSHLCHALPQAAPAEDAAIARRRLFNDLAEPLNHSVRTPALQASPRIRSRTAAFSGSSSAHCRRDQLAPEQALRRSSRGAQTQQILADVVYTARLRRVDTRAVFVDLRGPRQPIAYSAFKPPE